MKIHTIGFTRKSASTFFTSLTRHGVTRLVDIRLNNVSQLAGFTKKADLEFFSRAICNIDYQHLPQLAPTRAILDPYKKQKSTKWEHFESSFLALLAERKIED